MVSSYWEGMDLWVPGTDASGSKNLTWEQLDFNRNCSHWGHWLSAMLQTDSWNPKITIGMSVESAMIYYASAMPKGYHTTFDEVAKWFAYNMYHTPYPENSTTPEYYLFSERFNATVLYGPKAHCPTEFCKAVGYTGNQDLCGIGVVVSYYLEGILATMYLLAFTIHQMRQHLNKKVYEKPRPTHKQGVGNRIFDAFRGSLDIFLGGAMLISVAMLGASVYAGATNFKERTGANPDLPSPDSIYEMALALIASNFSVFPVMLLYALAKHDGHRKWLHRSVLFLLWGLSVTVVYLAPRGEVDYTLRKSGQRNFECDQRGSQYWHVVKATQFLVIGLPLLWLVLTVFVTTGFRIPGMVDKPWVKRWRSMWRLMIAWINMLIMWGILAYFTYFRQKIIDAADGLDKNDKWTFGQVLALAAWAPILAELFYILAFGLEDGLSGHMPAGYHAVHIIQPDPNMGIPLLDRVYDKKLASTISIATTISTPVTQAQAQPTMWQQNPGYQPVHMQQQHPPVQYQQTWDGYYHTGW
ncbi:c6 zinc finger domain containing protein [Colletotrichum incanum]|uniref:C6 zinc finger domain containing protein n=1 Tax=Colletotrichum incanum TaxID=1573173 RepID=A0A167BU01_COLIC|nr:c6 zinc finger domain containing protein [Colletotrichum incanum]OHW99444.1 hypothetical protein CSPAE12_01819 [Colletotrichum incanum]